MTATDDGRTAVMDELEDNGDELAAGPPPHSTTRSWRATPGGNGQAADVSLSDPQGARASAHLAAGHPDARRNNTVPSGHPAAPEDHYAAAHEARINVRADVAVDHKAPPTRPRAGWTGADPARPARFQFANLLRRFDKGIADHPASVDKIEQTSPLAARPPERKRLAGGRPNAAGYTGTGTAGVGPQRNTFRRVPSAWDEKILNGSTVTTGDGESRRARGWRL